MTDRRFYVYQLRDSRDGAVFYVGKGSGNRPSAHIREWRSGRFANPDKCARIGEIVRAGGRVVVERVAEGLTESDALSTERKLIASLPGLTNKSRGQFTADERTRAIAVDLLARVKPVDAWEAEATRTDRDRQLFAYVVSNLRELAGAA